MLSIQMNSNKNSLSLILSIHLHVVEGGGLSIPWHREIQRPEKYSVQKKTNCFVYLGVRASDTLSFCCFTSDWSTQSHSQKF